ncbi:MAG TPA: nucleotidyltransferase family protein [Gemmatimonadaceae bacterium]|nr:nucleotidyltransferase family protein [Gemmatimonadaceae bacterium]
MISGLVLAAGASRRFGSSKMRAMLAGRPLVRWSVEHMLASPVDEVMVVLGREAAGVRKALADLPVRCVENPAYRAGQSTSLRAGVASLGPAAEAVVIALGDQPAIDPTVIGALIRAYRSTGTLIVAPVYRGTRGTPVLFDATLFAELCAIEGDRGARGVIARDPSRAMLIDIDLPMPRDVNRAADLEALERSGVLLDRGVSAP